MKISNNFQRIKLGLLVAPLALTTFSANADNVEFKFSGQVSQAITQADNGTDTDTIFVDNNNSGTRLRLKGKVDVTPSLSAGVYWETQYQDNSSGAIDIGDSDNTSTFTSRIRDLWFKGSFGKVSLGQGNGAANGTSEVDNSGTWIADNSGDFLHGGLSFADSAGVKTIKLGKAFSNFDGLSRNNRLRYDTPSFGPLGLAASVGQDKYEIGTRYSMKMANGGKLGAALGYVDSKDKFTQVGLSASVLLGSGLNLTGHYGKKNPDAGGVDPKGYYLKVGQKFGATKNQMVSLGYQKVDDLAAAGDEAKRVSLSYVYNIPNKGIELFATAQKAELSRTAGDLEDLNTFSVGSRIKF